MAPIHNGGEPPPPSKGRGQPSRSGGRGGHRMFNASSSSPDAATGTIPKSTFRGTAGNGGTHTSGFFSPIFA